MSDKGYIRIITTAMFLSFIAAFLTDAGSWDYFRFKMGNYDFNKERAAIKDSVRLFSATLAGFYASGGSTAGLNMFPAEKLIKRRIFQEMNINRQSGLVLVADRDRSDVRQIIFSGPAHATAVVDESWFMQYQNAETRRPVSDKKANLIAMRYFLKKQWGKWIVVEYEVYGRDDSMPPVQNERFLKW